MDFKDLFTYATPYRASLAFCAGLMVVETAAALAVPWLGGLFVSGVLETGPVHVGGILVALLGLFGLQALLRFTHAFVLSRTSEQILADLRIRIYDHLQALPLGFHHQRRHGDILALLTYEVEQLSSFLTGTLLSAVPILLTALGAVVLFEEFAPVFVVPARSLLAAFAEQRLGRTREVFEGVPVIDEFFVVVVAA